MDRKLPVRRHQCKACPWKVSTVPDQDIPGGYCPAKHVNLRKTLAVPGEVPVSTGLRVMACHETDQGREQSVHRVGRQPARPREQHRAQVGGAGTEA